MLTLTFSATCFLLPVIKIKIALLLCADFSRKSGRLNCLQPCVHVGIHIHTRGRGNKKFVPQGHCLNYTSCLIQQMSHHHGFFTGIMYDPDRHSHSTLVSPQPLLCLGGNFRLVMNSGIAKHDKMEVLPRNTACHSLSCWLYWYINKYVSRHPSLQFTRSLEHLNFSWPPHSWLLHTVTQLSTAIAMGVVSKCCL